MVLPVLLARAFSPPNFRLLGTWDFAPGYDRSRLQRASAGYRSLTSADYRSLVDAGYGSLANASFRS